MIARQRRKAARWRALSLGLFLLLLLLLLKVYFLQEALASVEKARFESLQRETTRQEDVNFLCEVADNQRHIIVREIRHVHLGWSPEINRRCE